MSSSLNDFDSEVAAGLARAEEMLRFQRIRRILMVMVIGLVLVMICCSGALMFLWFFGDSIIINLGI